MTLLKQTQV